MKEISAFYLSTFIIAISIISCDKVDNDVSGYCGVSTGVIVNSEIGRIYFYDNPANSEHSKFYYIGNLDTLKRNGGFIPCDYQQQNFISDYQIGTLVMYSGSVKMQRDAEEPLYFGIELSDLKKID